MGSIMTKIKFTTILILFASGGTLFFSCKKTPEGPPIKKALIGGTMTISQVRALNASNNGANYKFTQDVSLYATVTMTDNYKTLYIRDQTGAICLKQLTAHGIYAGDSIRINLNESTLDLSGTASSLQIDSVDVSDSPTCKVVKLAVGRPTPPITVSIYQLLESASAASYTGSTGSFFVPNSIYDGQLVQINDIQFSLTDLYVTGGLTYYIGNTGATYYNHNLFDCGNIHTLQMSLYSGTTDFENQLVPYNNSGSIVGAISFYNNALQITPRSFADVNFNQPRCGLQTLNQLFDTVAFQSGATFSSAVFPGWTYPKPVGTSVYWEAASSGSTIFPYASVTPYSTDARNVVWLITPPIQYSSTKNINFQTATAYNTTTANTELSVLISTDYNGYNLTAGSGGGAQAHWTDITSSFNISTNGASNSWNLYNASPVFPIGVSLSSTNANTLFPSNYVGAFYVGFKYTGVISNPDSAAGYGVGNILIKN